VSASSPNLEALERLKQRHGLARGQRSAAVEPLRPDPANLHQPFPLTEAQRAYWLGRTEAFTLGGVSSHGYQEFLLDFWVDPQRLTLAWRRLIERHPMLRAVIDSDGVQRVLPMVSPLEIPVLDLRSLTDDLVEQALQKWRDEMSHQLLPADQWPLFDVRLSLLPGSRSIMHLSSDALTADVHSDLIVHRELTQLYQRPDSPLPRLDVSFRDYVLALEGLRDSQPYSQAARHWRERLDQLPPAPALPLAGPLERLGAPRFERFSAGLAPNDWRRFRQRAATHGLTPTLALFGAFAEALGRWSAQPDFTINLTLFDRKPLHPQIGQVVGDFTSTMLLEISEPAETAFAARALRWQARFLEDFEHGAYSGMAVLRDLARRNGAGGRPLMPVVFTGALAAGPEAPSLEAAQTFGREILALTQTPQVLIDHQVYQKDGALVINWDVVPAAFPPGVAKAMFETMSAAVIDLAREEADWSAPLKLEPPAADRQLIDEINRTARPIAPQPLHQAVLERIHDSPRATALIDGPDSLDYGQLGAWAQAVALAIGQAKGRVVAVIMPKGWRQVAAVLGVLLAGAAYAPLDPRWPAARRERILEQVEPAAVIVEEAVGSSPSAASRWPVVSFEKISPDDSPRSWPLPAVDQPAYVIFTSGSTGAPKGVVIEHGAAHNTVQDINHRFGVGPGDAVLGLSALWFDLSVYDIFGLLGAGGRLVLPHRELMRDPGHWLDLTTAHGVTIWNSAPALFQMLVDHAGEGLRRADSLRLGLLSGDWIAPDLPAKAKRFLPKTSMVSLGGATEAAIWSIFHPIGPPDPAWPSVPYGRPLANQSFHVLDHRLRPRPVWAEGELYIGGDGLAREYLRDPEKTAAAFIVHPETGQRLYRTGDMGRLRPNGDIEFLGRRDGQVKINGHRVELGEIEAALLGHGQVVNSLVRLWPAPDGRKTLTAYIIAKRPLEPVALKRHLAGLLPSHMIPTAYVFMERFPLNANGKLDPKALPAPEPYSAAWEPPKEGLEARLCELAKPILGLNRLAVAENLFDLGATSLDVVALHRSIMAERLGDIGLVEMFQAGSLRGMAQIMEGGRRVEDIQAQAENRARARMARRGVRRGGDGG